MKLELVITHNNITVDGVRETDLTDDQRRNIITKLFEWLTPDNLNPFLHILISQFGEYSCEDLSLEDRGDYIETYTLEI